MQNFLVVATTGLGDSLWSTPSIHGLKKHFPSSTIDLLTNPLGREIFLHNPDIRQTFVLNAPLVWQFLSLRKQLAEKRYAAAFLFHASQRLVLPLLACSAIPRIIGTKGLQKGLDDLLSDPMPNALHEIERRENLIKSLGASITDPSLRYFLQEEEKTWGRSWLQSRLSSAGKTVLLHPGAKDSYKCWSPQNYIALAKRLQKELGCHILIGIGSFEEKLGETFQKALPTSILVKNLSLRNYAAVMSACDLVITNDTGPMHLACALQMPVLTLFSPTDPQKCGPYHAEKARVLLRPRSCTPCLGRSCRLPFCLRQISVDSVFENVCTIFTQNL